MSDEIIDVETVDEQIVRCPQCGQRNRLYRQKRGVAYRCARCRTAIANPFSVWSRFKGRILMGAAVGVVVVAAGVAGWRYYERQPKVIAPPPEERPTPVENSTLAAVNGGTLKGATQNGAGTLNVNNTLDCDAIVKLVNETNMESNAPILFYVQQHRSATLRDLPNNRFRVMFSTGVNWDSLLETFTQDDLYFQFDRAVDFSERNALRDLTLGKVGPDQASFTTMTKVDFAR